MLGSNILLFFLLNLIRLHFPSQKVASSGPYIKTIQTVGSRIFVSEANELMPRLPILNNFTSGYPVNEAKVPQSLSARRQEDESRPESVHFNSSFLHTPKRLKLQGSWNVPLESFRFPNNHLPETLQQAKIKSRARNAPTTIRVPSHNDPNGAYYKFKQPNTLDKSTQTADIRLFDDAFSKLEKSLVSARLGPLLPALNFL
ncbi:unnamed protein product [Protopolystoma xenopodis]|uniref:Uncharacterized protein n=1 Tax=Protopolystoma xenopodis TaxID=117903 RepID=A0A3S5CCA3_9PLAT|nr:unnamed protein product [Protopolystoma xenopodis]